MTRLLIGNDFDEDLRDDRGWVGWWVERLAWFARDDDVLVLPEPPEDAFLEYVTRLTGTRADSLRVVVPPPGRHGADLLTADRLADPVFREALDAALAGRAVEEVFALWPHASVAGLARAVGAPEALPGHGFVSQGGGTMVNSKADFRAVAGGIGLSLPEGAVCTSRYGAEQAIAELVEQGHIAIVKHEFRSGGRGNEILTPIDGVRPIGARRAVPVADRPAIRAYLEQNWDWLTGGGRHRMVVERYFRDSAAYFAEFLVTDDGVDFGGHGELLSAPYGVAEIIPAAELEPEIVDRIVAGGRRMCEPVRAMGYRGRLSADAIVTPDRQVFYTEWNGRITGSTHTYAVVGDHVVGADYARDRVLLDRVWPQGWSVASFAGAVDALAAAGLAYDPATRTGVIITSAYDKQYQGVVFCVVAPDVDAAWDIDARLEPLFTASA